MERKDTEEDLKQWKNIVNSIDKTDIPIKFVSRIIFESDFFDISSSDQDNEIDVIALREIGYNDDDIQEIVNEVLTEVSNYNGTVDFLLNIQQVATDAQYITNTYLRRI